MVVFWGGCLGVGGWEMGWSWVQGGVRWSGYGVVWEVDGLVERKGWVGLRRWDLCMKERRGTAR